MLRQYNRAAILAIAVVVSVLAWSGFLFTSRLDVVDDIAGFGENRRRLRNHSKRHAERYSKRQAPFSFLGTLPKPAPLSSYIDPKTTESQVKVSSDASEFRPAVEYVTDPQNLERLRRAQPTMSVSKEVNGNTWDMPTIDVLSIGSETRIDYVSCGARPHVSCFRVSGRAPDAATVVA